VVKAVRIKRNRCEQSGILRVSAVMGLVKVLNRSDRVAFWCVCVVWRSLLRMVVVVVQQLRVCKVVAGLGRNRSERVAFCGVSAVVAVCVNG